MARSRRSRPWTRLTGQNCARRARTGSRRPAVSCQVRPGGASSSCQARRRSSASTVARRCSATSGSTCPRVGRSSSTEFRQPSTGGERQPTCCSSRADGIRLWASASSGSGHRSLAIITTTIMTSTGLSIADILRCAMTGRITRWGRVPSMPREWGRSTVCSLPLRYSRVFPSGHSRKGRNASATSGGASTAIRFQRGEVSEPHR